MGAMATALPALGVPGSRPSSSSPCPVMAPVCPRVCSQAEGWARRTRPGPCCGRPGGSPELGLILGLIWPRGEIQGPPAPGWYPGTPSPGLWGRNPQAPVRPRGAGRPGGRLHPGPVGSHWAQAWPCRPGLPSACGAVPPPGSPHSEGAQGDAPPSAGLIRLSPFSSSLQGSVAAWPPWRRRGCECWGHGEGRELPARASAVKKTWILTSGISRRCWARRQPPGELGRGMGRKDHEEIVYKIKHSGCLMVVGWNTSRIALWLITVWLMVVN